MREECERKRIQKSCSNISLTKYLKIEPVPKSDHSRIDEWLRHHTLIRKRIREKKYHREQLKENHFPSLRYLDFFREVACQEDPEVSCSEEDRKEYELAPEIIIKYPPKPL